MQKADSSFVVDNLNNEYLLLLQNKFPANINRHIIYRTTTLLYDEDLGG